MFCRYSIIQCLHTRFADSLWAGLGRNWYGSAAGGVLIGFVLWEVTCGVCHGSADIWNYVCLCIVLKQAACVGDMYGYRVVRMVIIVKFCWYVLVKLWCYWWDRIHVCCLGCAVHKMIGVRCVLYTLCVPDICLRLRLVCPIYDIWHVLHVSLQMALLSSSCVLLTCFGFVSCCRVLVLLKAIPTLVCLNRFMIFLILGL